MAALRKTPPRKRIAKRVQASRLKLGFSQEVAAKMLGVHRDQWRRIEAGLQSIPAERLCDVAKIVETTPNVLLGIELQEAA